MLDLSEGIGEPFYKDSQNRNDNIEKITYILDEKRIFVNKNLYFDNVSPEVWGYKIGGYQVLDKYLKSHKDEKIDVEYFSKIIKTLHQSLKIESEITKCDW